jgi:hypothetical protein
MFLFHLAFIPSSRPQIFKHGFAALFFAVLVGAVNPLCAAEKSNIVPCNIKLVFGVDDKAALFMVCRCIGSTHKLK